MLDYTKEELVSEETVEDLDKAVILCLETKIKKLTSEGKPIHQDTIKTLNYFKEKSRH